MKAWFVDTKTIRSRIVLPWKPLKSSNILKTNLWSKKPPHSC